MKCFVVSCKNDSRRKTKAGQGITFHMFPSDLSQRTSWLAAINQASYKPKNTSVVCSEHFCAQDLFEDKSGRRKVKHGAVPKVKMQVTDKSDNERLGGLWVCRICLAMDVRLLSIEKLKMAYENLTGITVNPEILPQYVCTECASRLNSCVLFKQKATTSHSLLMEIVDTRRTLTLSDIKCINREENLLTSFLSTKTYDPNYTDLHIDQTTDYKEIINNLPQTDEPQIELTEAVPLPIEIKEEENDIFIPEIDKNNIDLPDISDNDNNYIPSDKDYSSDDNIPLEKCKKDKKKNTKIEKKHKVKKKKNEAPKIDRRRKPLDDVDDSLFVVTHLTFEEQVEDILKRRESSNYKNSVYKCDSCYKGFLDEHAYNGHMIRHSNQCGEHECEICKTHFKHSNALRKHITAHHSARYSCRQCPYLTTHRQTARLHVRWHKGTTYECPHCLEQFARFTTYMGHIRIKHPSQFVCELCGHTFVSNKGIELHKNLKHRLELAQVPEDGPACSECGVRFVSSDALRTHLSVSHHSNHKQKGRRSNEEKEQGEEEGDKKSCRVMRKQEGPISCEQCGVQLEDSRAYHSHFRRSHPDKNRTNYPAMKTPCMCEQCGRMFQSYALLKDHRWVHTGERPFKCGQCDKTFRMKQRLVAHSRVHSLSRARYHCTVCGKHFSTHSNRQRHMFIHTGLKPFKCEMCGKGFKHSSEKRAHVTYVHLKKPWPKRSRARTDARQNDAPQPSDVDMSAMWSCDKMTDIHTHKQDYYNMKI